MQKVIIILKTQIIQERDSLKGELSKNSQL